jgi:hypothetical protein
MSSHGHDDHSKKVPTASNTPHKDDHQGDINPKKGDDQHPVPAASGPPKDQDKNKGKEPPLGGPDLTDSKVDFRPGSPDIEGTAMDIRHSADETPRDEKGNKDGARSAVGHPPIGSGGPIPGPGDDLGSSGAGGLPTPSQMGALASPDTGLPKRQRPAPGEDDGSFDIDPDHPNLPGQRDPIIPKQEINPAKPDQAPGAVR